jgi:peptidoglycan/xylan/chitin deacetylase (PgdA/CDA1 family)
MRIALLLAVVAALAQGQTRDLRVAVTFDDLPAVAIARCDPVVFNRRLLAGIKRNDMPAAALVVTGPARCGAAQLPVILADWARAGHEIGSHTHTHRDFNTLSLQTYLADVDSADVRLRPLLRRHNAQLRYFRHPLLHAGDTRAKKQALEAHLRAKGYQVAVVTVDNQEWVFAGAYAAAKRRGDRALMERILPAYYAHIDSSFAYYESLSQRIFKRQIPQVLLLHANEINADHLDDVARVIRRRGYRFISLREALQDSAYRRPDNYVGRAGISWLQRWALDQHIPFQPEPREPAWLQGR